MSKGLLELSPAWCNNKIITYDFCLTPYACLSGTTSPMPTLYNSKVYYTIPTSPTTYLWWSINLNKWVFSEVLGTPSNITLDYTGDYPYTSTVKWDGNFVGSEFFKTCDCTCFTKPNYSDNNFLPINECGVITIYPMGISCTPIPPSKVGGTGSLSLLITGGTPPYSIRLLNSTGNSTYGVIGSSNFYNIPNLLVGTYFVEVTDNFGDFQQVINCSIVAPPPLPTPTPPPIPTTPQQYQEITFCLRIKATGDRNGPGFSIDLSFIIFSFNYTNNIITPIFISNTGEEFVIWDYTSNVWSLSATSSSQLTTPSKLGPQTPSTWKMINSTPLPPFPNIGRPVNTWSLFNTSNPIIPAISSTNGVCLAPPILVFWINESWWQYYGSNIPPQYRGVACGGNNKTPYFKWFIQNPGGVIVTSYDILCTHIGTGDVYWNITNINPSQFEVSDTIPWQSPAVTGSTQNNSLRNNRGWQGPCLPPFSNPNFSVTLTANSVSGSLTATINFIYCQTVTTGICSI
jgi:hypothetical protein